MTITRNVTLDELLDEAVAELRGVRRRVAERRLKNDDYRAKILDDVTVELLADNRCCELGLQSLFGAETFTSQTTFAIDIDKLRQLLDLILEYLPRFLALFADVPRAVTMASLTLLAIAVGLFLPTSADAQTTICIDGQCAFEMTNSPYVYSTLQTFKPIRTPVQTVARAVQRLNPLAQAEQICAVCGSPYNAAAPPATAIPVQWIQYSTTTRPTVAPAVATVTSTVYSLGRGPLRSLWQRFTTRRQNLRLPRLFQF